MRNYVGFYQSREIAEQVKRELDDAGYDHVDIYSPSSKQEGFWEELKSAFGFADEEDQAVYAEATRRGAVAVKLTLDEDEAAEPAIQIMQRFQPLNLEAQAAEWQKQGWQATAANRTSAAATNASAAATNASTAAGQQKSVVPVVQEELQVGKREVVGGGIRVHSRVTEKPVEAKVNLREERVSVERRPVDRPVSDADRAFQERAVEVTERVEQAVVAKQARVVEEVVVNKDVQQRTETVRDTVRRTDVDVQKVGPDDIADGFVNEIARDQRYQGRDWTSLEPEFQRTFESRYPGSKWEQVKDAVHRGYDKVRAKV